MTVVLIFLTVVVTTSIWWLSHQRLGAKPWLESGLDSLDQGSHQVSLPKAKVGLLVILAVVGMLFTLFFSSHFMRQEIEDWRSMPLPSIVWINGVLLLAASLYLQSALVAARRRASELEVVAGGDSALVNISNDEKARHFYNISADKCLCSDGRFSCRPSDCMVRSSRKRIFAFGQPF